MKEQISSRQFTFLTINLIIASSPVVLPNALVDVSLQNTWLVFPFLILFMLPLIYFGLLGISELQSFNIEEEKSWKVTGLAIFMIIFTTNVLIRDFSLITSFIESTLLPLTPADIITLMLLLTTLYLAWAGIEVITRFTEMVLVVFILVHLFIPIVLIDQYDLTLFQPILGWNTIPSIFQSSYIGLAWIGEFVILFLVIGIIEPIKKVRKKMAYGMAIGVGMFALFVFVQLAVLGSGIIRNSGFPTLILVQQIRMTEFLDRVDAILISLYFPIIFAKLALFLYVLNHSLSLLTGNKTKVTLVPLGIMVAIFSIGFFDSKFDRFEFQIHTWATFGLLLEIIIACMMFLVVRDQRKKQPKYQPRLKKLVKMKSKGMVKSR